MRSKATDGSGGGEDVGDQRDRLPTPSGSRRRNDSGEDCRQSDEGCAGPITSGVSVTDRRRPARCQFLDGSGFSPARDRATTVHRSTPPSIACRSFFTRADLSFPALRGDRRCVRLWALVISAAAETPKIERIYQAPFCTANRWAKPSPRGGDRKIGVASKVSRESDGVVGMCHHRRRPALR